MASNSYQIYIEETKRLAETIVVKSSETAEALNQWVMDYYGKSQVDLLDPASYKYYKNIAGEYHFTDTEMTVASMDTLETIVFSKETLAVHTATKNGYRYGTRQYKELVSRYPEQELLILGILYPCDKATAIAAPDGTILSYPPELVESHEYSLIPKLQSWINGYKVRWVNQQFGISDPLYPATHLGIMYLNMVPAILEFRLEACKTNEAHSYHIRQYLASHGFLDAYMDLLTLKQALFLYRNIMYIDRNAGKRETFEWLVDHIMTERYLPLAEYTMRHDVSKQPDQIYPELLFKKSPVNAVDKYPDRHTRTLTQLLAKEDPMAPQNYDYRVQHENEIREQMENSLSSVVMTKVLESSVVDYTNSSPYNLPEILLNHWIAFSADDRYRAVIVINNPKSGDQIPINAKEAFIFAWFAFCQTIGIQLEKVPQIFAKRVLRYRPAATVGDLMSVVDSKLVSQEVALRALSMQPRIDQIISTEGFYLKCKEIYSSAQMQRALIASQEHYMKRGMVHGLVSRIYSDRVITFAETGEDYSAWLTARGLNITGLTVDDYNLLYTTILKDATGISGHTGNSLKELQAGMVRLLTQLSSYSIQILTEINNLNLRRTDWPMVRPGNVSGNQHDHLQHESTDTEVISISAASRQHLKYSLQDQAAGGLLFERTKPHLEYIIPNLVTSSIRTRFGPVMTDIGGPRPSLGKYTRPWSRDGIPIPGLDIYLGLTQEQQQDLKDVYQEYPSLYDPRQIQLSNIVIDRDLSDLSE